MKLAPRTYTIQWNLHAWAGVVASVFLFLFFYAGVFALYKNELAVWQNPVLHAAPSGAPVSFDRMFRGLEEAGLVAPGVHVGFAVSPERRFAYSWVRGDGHPHFYWVDSATGAVAPERSRLADEMNSLHFLEQVPFGREFSGLVSVALLVVIVSGLLIHIKDLRRQWWQFRPAQRLRFSASDAHKVLGVFGLPFATVIAWSGVMLCVGGLVIGGFAWSNLDGDMLRLARMHDPSWLAHGTSEAPGPTRPLDEIVATARAALGDVAELPSRVDIDDHGEAGAHVKVEFDDGSLGKAPYAVIDSQSGAVVMSSTEVPAPPSGNFSRILFDLHFGTFGGWLVQALFALLSLAVCAVIATGNLVWLERRDPKRERRGNRALPRLTVGGMGGLVLASAAYVAANRVLAADLPSRPDREFTLFLLVWAVAAVASFAPWWSARRIGAGFALASAVLFAGVVLWDAVFLDANLFTALGLGLPDVFAVELLLFGLAALSGGLARALARPRGAVAGEINT